MTRILINFVLIFTIIYCELKSAHSRTTHNNIRNTRSFTNTLKSEDFIQLKDLRRPFIIDQGEIEYDNCAPTCEHFKATENKAPKNYAGVSGSNCFGWLDSCRRFGSQNDEENPAAYCYTKEERHLIWTKEEFRTTFRNTTEKCIKKTLPPFLPSINNYECNICLCMCTEESNDSKSITNWAFSLLPQESDIDNNKIVTGVRIRTRGKLIYLQIEEGHIKSDNEDDWKPFSGSENLIFNKDYILLEPNSRSLNLDVIYVPFDYVVTGVRFTRIPNTNFNDRGYAVSMEVQGTQLNMTTGELIKSTRTWYSSKTTPTSSAGYERMRIELSLDDITSSLLTNPDHKLDESNTYIKFGPENRRNDTGQFTIPYLSLRNVESRKIKTLNGIGLLYQKPQGYVGFIEPKIYYNYAINNYVNDNVKIRSKKENNIESESSENIIGNSEAYTATKDDIDENAAESLNIEKSSAIVDSEEDEIIHIKRPVMYETKQDLNKMRISKPHFVKKCKMVEVTTQESSPEAMATGESLPAAFLKHSSNEHTNEEEQNMIGPSSEKLNSEPTAEVVTEEITSTTSRESPIILKEENLQIIDEEEPIIKTTTTEAKGILETGWMEVKQTADEIFNAVSEATIKFPEEEKIVTESTAEINVEEQNDIIQEHLLKKITTVVSTIEEDVTKGSVNEINNLVQPQSQSAGGSATTLKIQIMFYVITLFVIISLV